MITLYVFEHNLTKKKYFGKSSRSHTLKELKKYNSSSSIWKEHINEFGEDFTVEIFYQSNSLSNIINMAILYSEFWKIDSSDKYLNIRTENGIDKFDGGTSNPTKGKKSMYKDGIYQLVHKDNVPEYLENGWILKGKPKSEEHKQALRKPKSEEGKKNMSEAAKGKVLCYNINNPEITLRISKEEFDSNDELVGYNKDRISGENNPNFNKGLRFI